MNQKTLLRAGPLLTGRALHSGRTSAVRIKPAPTGRGLAFVRQDLGPGGTIPVSPENLVLRPRCTALKSGRRGVITIEHLMAAFGLTGVTNAVIEVRGGELPQLDGTGAPWLRYLKRCGLKNQTAPVPEYRIKKARVEAFGRKCFKLLPAKSFGVTYHFTHRFPDQVYSCRYIPGRTSENRLAAARTFCRLSELNHLMESRLIKGGSLDNALIINDLSPEKLRKLSIKGRLDSENPRQDAGGGFLFKNRAPYAREPGDHKLLDLIGDLAVLPFRIKGRILAYGTGHRENTVLVQRLYSYSKMGL